MGKHYKSIQLKLRLQEKEGCLCPLPMVFYMVLSLFEAVKNLFRNSKYYSQVIGLIAHTSLIHLELSPLLLNDVAN